MLNSQFHLGLHKLLEYGDFSADDIKILDMAPFLGRKKQAIKIWNKLVKAGYNKSHSPKIYPEYYQLINYIKFNHYYMDDDGAIILVNYDFSNNGAYVYKNGKEVTSYVAMGAGYAYEAFIKLLNSLYPDDEYNDIWLWAEKGEHSYNVYFTDKNNISISADNEDEALKKTLRLYSQYKTADIIKIERGLK